MSERKPLILSMGEVLWDLFPDGPRFGGAPANFASHAAALGARVFLVSGVGADKLGDQALVALAQNGVEAAHVARHSDHPTGTVQVTLDAGGKPHFEIGREAAWDHLVWSAELEALAARCDALYFGTLGQRSPVASEVIRRAFAVARPDALRVLDVNLRAPFDDAQVIHESLQLANVLKLSEEELPPVADAAGVPPDLATLRVAAGLRLIAMTRGERGAVLLGETRSSRNGIPTHVVDTVGAGDSFTAALVVGLLRGLPLDEINRHACEVAAFVCSQPGATPDLPEHLKLAR